MPALVLNIAEAGVQGMLGLVDALASIAMAAADGASEALHEPLVQGMVAVGVGCSVLKEFAVLVTTLLSPACMPLRLASRAVPLLEQLAEHDTMCQCDLLDLLDSVGCECND
jgi:hypothetical protein